MYFIGGIQTDKDDISVVDTSDYSVKHYTRGAVLEKAKECKIYGVNEDSIAEFDLENYINARMAMDKLHGIESEYYIECNDLCDTNTEHPYYIKLNKINIGTSTRYDILDGTNWVEHLAFEGNNLNEFVVTIPKSLTYLGGGSLANCSIKRLELYSSTELFRRRVWGVKYLKTIYWVDTGVEESAEAYIDS